LTEASFAASISYRPRFCSAAVQFLLLESLILFKNWLPAITSIVTGQILLRLLSAFHPLLKSFAIDVFRTNVVRLLPLHLKLIASSPAFQLRLFLVVYSFLHFAFPPLFKSFVNAVSKDVPLFRSSQWSLFRHFRVLNTVYFAVVCHFHASAFLPLLKGFAKVASRIVDRFWRSLSNPSHTSRVSKAGLVGLRRSNQFAFPLLSKLFADIVFTIATPFQ
jgi:hypothetical protein